MVTAPWRRRLVCASLCLPLMLLGSGCKTSSGWRAPWSGWGWSGASSPNATALNISKPSTQAPAPTNTAGPSRSYAGGSSGANPTSGVATASATSPAARTASPPGGVAAYPATAQADAYPDRTASTWQQEPGAGKGASAAGYKVGPYGMQQQNQTGPASGGAEGYRTADQNPDGRTRTTEDSAAAPPANPGTDQPGSIYGDDAGAATATEADIYGSANETSPAEETGAASAGPYSGGESPAETPAARAYGPPNTVAPAARPSTSPPATSGSTRPPVPQSLLTSGGYRPGSTNTGNGARNASHEEGLNATAPPDNRTESPMYR